MSIAETASDAILCVNQNEQIVFWNTSAETIFGYSAAEALELLASDLFSPEDYALQREAILANLTNKTPEFSVQTREFSAIRKSGEIFPAEISISHWNLNGLSFLTAIARDISSRKKAERALKSTHEENRMLLSAISSILISLDHRCRVKFWNQRAEEMFHIPESEVIGKVIYEVKIDLDWTPVVEAIHNCADWYMQTRVDNLTFIRPNGAVGELGLTITPIFNHETLYGYLVLGADITNRKINERRHAQAEKMKSLGELAAGVAHEINTPMQYLASNNAFVTRKIDQLFQLVHEVDHIRQELDLDSESRYQLDQVFEKVDMAYLENEIPTALQQSKEGILTINRLVRSIKELSHPDTSKVYADINHIIESSIVISHPVWKRTSVVNTDLDPNLPLILCLPTEIGQVILNLITNAAYAVGKMGGMGSINITSRRNENWVDLAIQDTGCGIPEEIQTKVFDKFFTTKEVGEGTGQGLYIARKIIEEDHGGQIWFQSSANEGATFFIRLPMNG